jgi:hypothetical protein
MRQQEDRDRVYDGDDDQQGHPTGPASALADAPASRQRRYDGACQNDEQTHLKDVE